MNDRRRSTLTLAALVIALSLMAGMVQDVRARIHSGSAHLTILSVSDAEVFEGAEALVDRLEAAIGRQFSLRAICEGSVTPL